MTHGRRRLALGVAFASVLALLWIVVHPSAPETPPPVSDPLPEPVSETEAIAPPAREDTLRIVDEASAQSRTCTIQVSSVDGRSLAGVSMFSYQDEGSRRLDHADRLAVTDAHGMCALGEAELGPLPPRLLVTKDGWLPASVDAPEYGRRYRVVLDPGHRLRVWIRDVEGAGIGGGRFRLSQAMIKHGVPPDPAESVPGPDPDTAVHAGISNEHGLVELGGLPPGDFWWDVQHDDYIPSLDSLRAQQTLPVPGPDVEVVLWEPLACAVVPRGGEVVSTRITTHGNGFHGGWHVVLARRLEQRFPGAYTVAGGKVGDRETLTLRVLFAGREWQEESFPLVPLSELREPFYLEASAPENPEAWGACRIKAPHDDIAMYLTAEALGFEEGRARRPWRMRARFDEAMQLPAGTYTLVVNNPGADESIEILRFAVAPALETSVEARLPADLCVVAILGRRSDGTFVRTGRLRITRMGDEREDSLLWTARTYLLAGRYRIEIVERQQPGDFVLWAGSAEVALQPRPDFGLQEVVVDLVAR